MRARLNRRCPQLEEPADPLTHQGWRWQEWTRNILGSKAQPGEPAQWAWSAQWWALPSHKCRGRSGPSGQHGFPYPQLEHSLSEAKDKISSNSNIIWKGQKRSVSSDKAGQDRVVTGAIEGQNNMKVQNSKIQIKKTLKHWLNLISVTGLNLNKVEFDLKWTNVSI